MLSYIYFRLTYGSGSDSARWPLPRQPSPCAVQGQTDAHQDTLGDIVWPADARGTL